MSAENEKSTLELALVRLYRYSASEQPSDAMDARILKRARRVVIYTSPAFYARTAIAASVMLLIFAGSVVLGRLTIGASQPKGSVLGPWVPLQVQVDGSSWPPSDRDYQLLGLSKYELPSAEFTDVSLGNDNSGRIDLRDFASQASASLSH